MSRPAGAIPPESLAPADCWGRSSALACLAATCTGVVVLALLLGSILAAALKGPPDNPWYAIGANLSELFSLLRRLATQTAVEQHIPPTPGYQVGIAGSLWLLGLVAVIGIPVGVGAGVYLEEYAPPGRTAIDHPDQHRQPGGRALDRLRHPGIGVVRPCLRDQGPGAGADAHGRRADAQPADPADHRDDDPGGPAGRAPSLRQAAVAPGGDALAGRPRPRAALGAAGDHDRHDPRPVAGDRRDRAPAHGRRGRLDPAASPRGRSTATRPCRSRSTSTPGCRRQRVPDRRRRRHPDPGGDLALDERRGHRDPQPFPALSIETSDRTRDPPTRRDHR